MHAISALLRKFAVSIYLEEESARNLKWKSFASKAIGDQFFFYLTNNINAYCACILRKGHGTDETGEIWCGTGISNIWITVSILWTAYGDQFSLVDNLQVMQTEKGILCPIKRVWFFEDIYNRVSRSSKVCKLSCNTIRIGDKLSPQSGELLQFAFESISRFLQSITV